ncbi:Protein-S-isoprenylcysteine O-methyltransferase Ste14 [Pseudobutyrivibrio sp. NOR37]|uniref:Isoprenylcysteine carboxylmethyltransferase family protein n=2 Tax=Lachnospiraceae TaxID=186803 RepID=A0A6M0LF44_PSEXY|nr:isoprenylcysteine carboxylmethyltransferase family protein [Pseudobutyrivibrio xylanivorans]SFR60380.1 Protein-S-isoprenylcysteine O-methyltransferase Ste14 [Pseudobutyrivibrio sp. NOR37]
MDKKLLTTALTRVLAGIVIMAALIFIPAGTLVYWQGWLLLGILFVPMIVAGFVLMYKAPELLRKRLNMKEEQKEQKLVVALSGIMFITAFAVAGLNFRFKWMVLSDWICIAAAIIFLIAYTLYGEVLRENEYLSRTIEIQGNQRVVDTGLYGAVRHPMYMVTLVMFLAMPVVLGSIISLVITLLYIPIIVLRIKNEEKVLAEGLPGYRDYMRKVRSRLIPHVW